jgi:hypothetical protein
MGKYIIFEEGDALLVIDAINKVLGCYIIMPTQQLKPFGPHFDWIIDLDPNFLFFFFFFVKTIFLLNRII